MKNNFHRCRSCILDDMAKTAWASADACADERGDDIVKFLNDRGVLERATRVLDGNEDVGPCTAPHDAIQEMAAICTDPC